MARQNPVFHLTGMMADADLSSKQFYCVKMSDTDNKVSLCDTQGEHVIGILQDKPNADAEAAEVMALGISKIVAAETLTAGDHWGTDADGKAVVVEATATGADTKDFAAGVVVEGCSADELATVTIGMGSFKVPS